MAGFFSLLAMLHLRGFGAIKPRQEAGNIIVQGSCHVLPTHSPEQMCFDEMIGIHFISPAPPLPSFTLIITHDKTSHFKVLCR